jgi:hypothetical protein
MCIHLRTVDVCKESVFIFLHRKLLAQSAQNWCLIVSVMPYAKTKLFSLANLFQEITCWF